MLRQASSITATSNPALRASSAEKRTQKSSARPATKTVFNSRSRRYPSRASGRPVVVLEECRIGINAAAKALAHHQAGARDIQIPMEFGARRAPHTMHRPEHLGAIVELDGLERLAARMVRRKGDVVAWMPVLRQHHIGEFLGDAVDGGHDLFAAGNGERPAGAKIVLHVDHQQHVAVGYLHRGPHSIRPAQLAPAALVNVDLPALLRNHRRAATMSREWRADLPGMQRSDVVRVD